ncbi:hypothetical protein BJ742DRAFT_250714 [Cladochytrium replicatum]|nr:hypothetical protein BJ742DRAFT_250714 [Cladochytrium replicatum]
MRRGRPPRTVGGSPGPKQQSLTGGALEHLVPLLMPQLTTPNPQLTTSNPIASAPPGWVSLNNGSTMTQQGIDPFEALVASSAQSTGSLPFNSGGASWANNDPFQVNDHRSSRIHGTKSIPMMKGFEAAVGGKDSPSRSNDPLTFNGQNNIMQSISTHSTPNGFSQGETWSKVPLQSQTTPMSFMGASSSANMVNISPTPSPSGMPLITAESNFSSSLGTTPDSSRVMGSLQVGGRLATPLQQISPLGGPLPFISPLNPTPIQPLGTMLPPPPPSRVTKGEEFINSLINSS